MVAGAAQQTEAMSRRSSKNSRAGAALLAASAVGAVNTWNARKPLSRSGWSGVAAFFAGWLTSELPWHAVGAQAIGTAGFARKGALGSRAGRAALGLSAASWVTLVTLDRQARKAGPIFDTAIEDAFAPFRADPATTDMIAAAEPVEITRKRIAMGPFTQYRRRYVRRGDGNLSYGDAGRRNRFDIWRSADLRADANAPVLLQVHGGAWVVGNKQQQATPLMAHLCDRGWVCVSINYRLSPRATWPDHIVDVKRAIAWIKANIADYGGDPDFVAITGGSAGGHLSSLAALSPNEPRFQPGFESADTSLVAAVPFYGAYDFTNRDRTGRQDMAEFVAERVVKLPLDKHRDVFDLASPMSWVNADAPPMFMVHGTNDSLIPVEQGRSFVAMLRAVSRNPVAYAELPGTQHAFEVFDSPRTLLSAAAVTRFLETVRRMRRPGPSQAAEPASAATESDRAPAPTR